MRVTFTYTGTCSCHSGLFLEFIKSVTGLLLEWLSGIVRAFIVPCANQHSRKLVPGKSYTVSSKLDVLQFAEKNEVRAAICKFKHLIFSLG